MKAVRLTREVCVLSRCWGLREPLGDRTGTQKSAEGAVGQAVGKANETLRKPKGGANG